MSIDGPERRSEPRVPGRVEVRFAENADAAKAFRAFSINFSSGGLCIRTQKTHRVGTEMMLELAVQGKTYKLLGVVAWARGDVIGVRFKDLKPEERQSLEAIAQTLAAPE